jgi:hypothetical protein
MSENCHFNHFLLSIFLHEKNPILFMSKPHTLEGVSIDYKDQTK